MTSFQFRAVSPDGLIAQGRIEANDRLSASNQLLGQGYTPLEVESFKPSSGLWLILTQEVRIRPRAGPAFVISFLERLSVLLDAEVSMEASLALLSSSESEALVRNEASQILKMLRQGASLSEAMEARGDVFPALVISTLRAGEASGSLTSTVNNLVQHLAKAEAMRQALRSALIYPGVLIATAIASVLLILLFVLPELEPVFAESRMELPLLTRVALAGSHAIRDQWLTSVCGLTLLALVVRWLLSDPTFRRRRDALILRIPLIGVNIRRAETGRLARVLGTLISGGVSVAPALQLAQPVLRNQVLREAIVSVTAAVREGGSLADTLAQTRAIPDVAVQLVRIGESTAKLGALLLRAAELLETDVQKTLERSLALLVPMLTILVGGLVAGIVASVMLAVLGMNDMVK